MADAISRSATSALPLMFIYLLLDCAGLRSSYLPPETLVRVLAVVFFLAATSDVGADQRAPNLGFIDSAPVAEDVFAAWRARQAQTKTVRCKVGAITHYSPGSQFVAGAPQLLPTHGRSAKHSASLQFSGPAKFCFHHQGQIWHRLFGQLLPVDWVRLSDGNQYVASQLRYESIPGWRPKPKVRDRYSPDPQQRGWDDELLTPLIQHFRPFNSRSCPFEHGEEWSIKQSRMIEGIACFRLAKNQHRARVGIRDYQYWVAPSLAMSVVRLVRFTNGSIETQFDMHYVDGKFGPEPESFQFKRFDHERILEFSKIEVVALGINQPMDPSDFQLESVPRKN